MLPVAVVAFMASSVSFLAGLRKLLWPSFDPRLETPVEGSGRRSAGLRIYVTKMDRVLGAWLQRRMGPRRVANVQRRLVAAGHHGKEAVDNHLGRRATHLIAAFFLGMVAALTGAVFALPLAVIGAWLMSDGSLTTAARKRGQQIQSQLPDFLDVAAVMLSAGLSFREALRRVADAMSGPVADEIDFVLRELDLGVPLRQALRQLRERNQSESFDKFVTALAQAEELGAPLSDAMISLATDARRDAAQAARRRAARTTPRVSLVLTLIFVPATLALLVAGLFFGAEVDFGEILPATGSSTPS